MWILENEGGAFEGRRLWLRPGKRYLFGRTVAEPGQLAIKGDLSKSVSRKHCTITVAAVTTGDGRHPNRRSRVTVEDLGSKGGTRINEHKIKNDSVVLTQEENTLQMGSFQSKFSIKWRPVVLSYSFTAKELRADPLTKLQESLEQLDIKYVSDYDTRNTTHVVTRKRNTPKGLQALVEARYIVTNDFVDAVTAVASPAEDGEGYDASPLEGDFDANWPDAMKFLPPAAEDAAPMADEKFAPDPQRAEIFDGYTFIFYNKNQWEQLMAPITSGKGKALLREVVDKATEVDEFIRYVKGVAGEKGLGEFEDGSEGKGVVVVRWIPNDGEYVQWFENFYTTISLRLDHRLIDQKDFIGAIVNNNPSALRRPLEEEDSQSVLGESRREQSLAQSSADLVESMPARRAPLRSRRGKGATGSRFKGFGIDIDDEDEPVKPAPPHVRPQASGNASQESLFVSQDNNDSAAPDSARQADSLQRKRPASSSGNQVDIMEGFAPTAAQVKRRRVEAGEDPVPRRAEPVPEVVPKPAPKAVKVKKEMDVLGIARQHREEAEARARAEREELEAATDGLDLAEIRRLQITEEMPLRQVPTTRTREQDIVDGRWNPAWNGRKNFKKFQKRGAEQGRALQKIIVPLEQVQNKAFGIGADYWLEDESQQRAKKKQAERSQKSMSSRNNTQTQDNAYEILDEPHSTVGSRGRRAPEKLPAVDSDEENEEPTASRPSTRPTGTAETFPEDDDDDDDDVVISMSAPRSSRSTAATAARQSQQQTSQRPTASRSTVSTTQRSSQPSRGTAAAMASIRGKRPAATALPTREQPANKRPKAGAPPSDDESEDELRFRFRGRR